MTVYVKGSDKHEFSKLPGFVYLVDVVPGMKIEEVHPAFKGIVAKNSDLFDANGQVIGYHGQPFFLVKGKNLEMLVCRDDMRVEANEQLAKILTEVVHRGISHAVIDIFRPNGEGCKENSRKAVVNKMVRVLKRFEDAYPNVQINLRCSPLESISFLSKEYFRVDPEGISGLFYN